jgi:hypothetical protein
MSKKLHTNLVDQTDCLSEQTLFAYIDNKLTDEQRYMVEKHLIDCELCSDALEGLALVKNRAAIAETKAEVKEKFSAAQKKESKVIWFDFKYKLLAAASVALLVLSIFVLNHFLNKGDDVTAYKIPTDTEQQTPAPAPPAEIKSNEPVISTPTEKNIEQRTQVDLNADKAANGYTQNEKTEKKPEQQLVTLSEKTASAKVSVNRKADASSSPGTGDASHYSTTTPSSVAVQPLQKEAEKQTNNLAHNTMASSPPPAKTQEMVDEDNIGVNKNEEMVAGDKAKDDAKSETARDEKVLKQAPETETKKAYASSSYKKRSSSSMAQSDVPVAAAPEGVTIAAVNSKAQFPGGETEQQKFIKKTMNSKDCKDCRGDIIVSFVVNTTGEVQDPKIIKGITGCECLGTEALRIIKAMPNWQPGKNDGKPVSTICSLSIKFE